MTRSPIKYLDPVVVSKLNSLEMKAKLIVEGFITGLHKSPYHGFSVEFAEHRAYNPGESLRNVDWKVLAKTDRLFTKRYEEETNLRCHVLLDVSDSMRYPQTGMSKLEYGAYLAASLSYLMVRQKDAAGFALFDDAVRQYVPPKARVSRLAPIFEGLTSVVENKDYFTHRTATASVLHQLAAKMGRRGLVVLITDLFSTAQPIDELFPALQHLRHQNHEVLIFYLLDAATETRFDFPNQPLVLKDLETGEELRIQPSQVREPYVAYMKQYQETLRRRCRELQIDLVEADVRTFYDKLLLDYLRKRARMVK